MRRSTAALTTSAATASASSSPNVSHIARRCVELFQTAQVGEIKTEQARIMRKIATDRRRLVRQRARISVVASEASNSNSQATRTKATTICNLQNTATPNAAAETNIFYFNAPNGMRLREVLTKELHSSDVGPRDRIVLPKNEAEANLPDLSDKEGIEILLRDVHSDKKWSIRFKFWLNAKSRMYVLENTGDLVRHYQLHIGDSITIYEDESKNLYVSTKKKREVVVCRQQQPSNI